MPNGEGYLHLKKYIPPPMKQTLPRQCKQQRSLGSDVNGSFCVQQNDEDLASFCTCTNVLLAVQIKLASYIYI